MKKQKQLDVSTRSFLTAILVIFVLMIVTYILTLIVPGGQYARIPDENGNMLIDTQAGFTAVQGGLPFWKWALSPFLALTVSGGGTLIAVIAFLLIIGGVFNALDQCGLMRYMLDKTAHKFGAVRYRLLAVVTALFMAMGAMIGSFEECVPLVPICVALAVSLGWDKLTGIGIGIFGGPEWNTKLPDGYTPDRHTLTISGVKLEGAEPKTYDLSKSVCISGTGATGYTVANGSGVASFVDGVLKITNGFCYDCHKISLSEK